MKLTQFISQVGIGLTLFICGVADAAGLLTPTNSGLPPLEIREHHVNVTIENGYAVTEVDQVFYNPNTLDLEALYSFPIPDSAAVGEFTYWIHGQPVTGEVIEKTQAKEIYHSEKAAGRHTALVEQDSHKTFDINVFPVKAQQDVKIRLVYIQPAQVDSSIGRYVYPLEAGGVDEQKMAFWQGTETVTEKFSFNVQFRSAAPIDALRLPKHPSAVITSKSNQQWQVNLDRQQNQEESSQAAAAMALNEDIVVYWRLQEGLPAGIDLVSYKPEASQRGTFMLTLTPGEDLKPITHGSDWTFVLDVSGSMQGKYASLIEGIRQGLGKLRQQDRFRVILFNERALDLTKGFISVDSANTNKVIHQLENYAIGGGTNLYAGLHKGLINLEDDRPAGVILVTDGVANVGHTEKRDFLKLLQDNDVRLFTFIVGNSANRPLLKEMTAVSNGFALSVSNSDDIVGHIALAASKITHQAFRDVKLKITGAKINNLTPTDIGNLYRGEQLTVFGHYWQPGEAEISLQANVGGEKKTYATTVHLPEVSDSNPEIERLWAYASIEHLQSTLDYFGHNKDTEQAITDIAVEYGLVTDFTSMIVVEESVFQALNIDRKNQQRVNTEQGARQQRKTQPIKDNRADTQQPMFTPPRPTVGGTGGGTGGGSGSTGPVLLCLILSLVLIGFQRSVSLENAD